MTRTPTAADRRGDEGFALMLVLFILLAVGLVAMGSAMLIGSSQMMGGYEKQQALLESAADAGLEETRARINGDPTIYPDSGYRTLESAVQVRDASGAVIPGVTRTTYAGPTGVATGQYGVFGSIVVVSQDASRHRVIRRGDIAQESFAKFAYFTNDESNIVFGGGDQIQGPVHSNDVITIHSTGATFRGPGGVTTAQTISGVGNGRFYEGYTERVAAIAMPTTADLTKLRTYATRGGTAFTAPTGGNPNDTRMRIEFVAVDVNGDGRVTGADEGFFKVYQSNNAAWLMAQKPSGTATLTASNYCGNYNAGGVFLPASSYVTNAARLAALQSPTRRCLLGGSDDLNGGFQANDGTGQWVARPFAWANMPPAIAARADAAYLYPLSHTYNPNFKGVIHVTGRVGVSGVVRGRVTLASTDDIFILDDITYANAPGVGNCSEIDMLGLFSGGDLLVADNTLNSPTIPQGGNNPYWDYDDSKNSVTIHGVLLTLGSFSAESYNQGATASESCEGTPWGRGCLYMAGGVIQGTRGAVGQADGHGFLKRYSYDACARVAPPPYFPTTGRFSRGRYYELNPVGFDVAAYLDRITAG
ncbi:MAG: hypothetical protein JWM27_2459 [Gemmatimonadetes bacterium]|nr:hypothetical protein [Gemmatimonadota bacterium]